MPFRVRFIDCFLFLAFTLLTLGVFAQTTRIRGSVVDAETGEPLPFVNVTFAGTAIGTITDFDGNYFLETRTPGDSVTFSMVGYYPLKYSVRRSAYQEIHAKMEQQSHFLDAVVVRPGENPAHKILRNIIANKGRNNPDNFDSYSYESYNKLQVDLNNISESMKDRRVFRQFDFVFNYVDTNAITGKTYLPIFISEAISDYYYQSSPRVEREVIKATKMSGVDNESVAQFTGKIYQNVNIYDNYINVFDQGLVSPIANAGLFYYRYYLIDSAYIDNRWCYQVSFRPRRRMEPTFTGDFWVNDTTWAIARAQVRMASGVNLNFVNDLVATAEYKPVNDSTWFPSNLMLFVDFNLTDKTTGFFGTKTSAFRNVRVNEPLPESLIASKEMVEVLDDALKKDDDYWLESRPFDLTPHEANIYSMVDSVKQVPMFRTFIDIVDMLVNYYYIVGYFEIGPYYKTYSFNEIEGNRFRLSGRTSNAFSNRLMISGFAAYGDKDDRFKYGAGLQYMIDKAPRRVLYVDYKYDIEQLGQSPNALTEDNLLTSVLRRNPNYKLSLIEEYKVAYEHEWFSGFSNTVEVANRSVFPTEFIPFVIVGDELEVNHLTTTTLGLNTRWLKDERYVTGEFERVSLGSPYPEINVRLTGSFEGVLGSNYSFLKAEFNYNHKQSLHPMGILRYSLDAGMIFGEVPYPLLKLHEGNETYALDKFAFNMMNYYEFASDQWVSLSVAHHFQGFFLNRIPLMRRLKWREVVTGKAIIGRISPENQSVWLFPEGLNSVTKPYVEAGVGVENIFKLLRVDALWRLSHLDNPNIERFGLRMGVQIIF